MVSQFSVALLGHDTSRDRSSLHADTSCSSQEGEGNKQNSHTNLGGAPGAVSECRMHWSRFSESSRSRLSLKPLISAGRATNC